MINLYGLISKLKGLFGFCNHLWLYKGLDSGLGFRWRKIECAACGKKQTSLTLKSSFNDEYKINQVLKKCDFIYFNDEIK